MASSTLTLNRSPLPAGTRRPLRERLAGLLVPVVLAALAAACFARLATQPGALLVDGDRPSVDVVERGEVRLIGNDLTNLYLPHHLRIADQIARHGRWSCWDPFGFGGRPRVGNPQAGLWYPPVWLAWWSAAPAVLGWLTVAHLLWGGFGTFCLVRSLGVGRWSAVVAGGCFEASPYMLAQTFEGHYPHVWAASWYPWAFWAAVLMRRGDQRGALALPPILALSLLTGHPQEGYYLLVALSVWALADACGAIGNRKILSANPLTTWSSTPLAAHIRLRRLAIWAGVFIISLGFSAIELIPDYKARAWLLQSSQLSLKHASHYHIDPLNLVQLLDPGALGGPADYFGHDSYWETVLSVGWVPLVLAVLALARSPRRALVRGWAILAAAAIVFAAGRRLGLFALLYELLPGMDQFRVPARSLFLACLGAAVLAGLGVETVASARHGLVENWNGFVRRYRRISLWIVLCLLIGQAAFWWFGVGATPFASSGPRENAHQNLALSESVRLVLVTSRLALDPSFWLALGGTLIALTWLHKRPLHSHRVSVVLGVLALAELGAHGHGLLKTAPVSRFLGPEPVSAALCRVQPTGPFRIRARDAFYNDLRASRSGFEKTNVYDFFQVQHAADLYEHLYLLFSTRMQEPSDTHSNRIERRRLDILQPVLDRMNVALLVTDRAEPGVAWPIAASGQWNGSNYTIYRNPTALPRAYVVPRARIAPADASAVDLFPAVDPREAVLMTADPLGTSCSRQQFTPASYDASDPDRVMIQVATEAQGLLVVADTWMPGWTAEVDGRPATILRGNHAQRVIPLPSPGEHVIRMNYRPPGLVAGLTISGMTVLLWLSGVVAVSVRADSRRSARRSMCRLSLRGRRR